MGLARFIKRFSFLFLRRIFFPSGPDETGYTGFATWPDAYAQKQHELGRRQFVYGRGGNLVIKDLHGKS